MNQHSIEQHQRHFFSSKEKTCTKKENSSMLLGIGIFFVMAGLFIGAVEYESSGGLYFLDAFDIIFFGSGVCMVLMAMLQRWGVVTFR